MAKQQHFKEEILLFSEGALYSVDKEFAGLVSKRGYVDARNMRLQAMSNHRDYALNQINGEVLLYPAIYNQCIGGDGSAIPTPYKCMYSDVCNSYIFEVWCDTLRVLPTFFRINGKIVALSAAIPFTVDYGIEGHKNESVVGGEIFLTDDHSAPQIYNIKDLLENSGIDFTTGVASSLLVCTQLYFTDFTLAAFTVNQQLPADHPVFTDPVVSTVAAFTGSVTIGVDGLLAGEYQYAFRYKNTAGDATIWSEPTPLAAVPAAIGSDSTNYPYVKTYGAGTGVQTLFGLNIRFRITNLLNYDNIEIRRISYNTGSALNTPGTDEIIYSFVVAAGQISVMDLFDLGATGTALTDIDEQTTLGTVDHAKAIRYFDKQLYLMNITYASRSVQSSVIFNTTPDTMFPVLWKITNSSSKAGHKDPYQNTYRKSYPRGETFGFATIFLDTFGAQTFALPVPGTSVLPPTGIWGGAFASYQMPNRRDPIIARSLINAAVFCSDVNYALNYTYEVFDLTTAVFKNDPCQYKNIAQLTDNSLNWKLESNIDIAGCPIETEGATEFSFLGSDRVRVNYQPFHPVNALDDDITAHNFVVCYGVFPDGRGFTNGTPVIYPQYAPKAFAPDYYALGMALTGVQTMPDFVSAFKVARTKPAGRIVAQGIGFYALTPADYDTFGDSANAQKSLHDVWFYCPDAAAGIVNMTEVMAGVASGAYELQCVSSLGFFSEPYSFQKNAHGVPLYPDRDYNIDMMTYARILYEDGTINNPDVQANTGNGNGYVRFGQWRNPTLSGTSVWNSSTGNKTFQIAAMSLKTSSANLPNLRSPYYVLSLTDALYEQTGTSGDKAFTDPGVRSWHEPLYVMNIVRKQSGIDTSANQQTYINTGHYQKVISIIGQSSGASVQSFQLVDERWEDCISKADDVTFERYVYVADLNGVETRWVDITWKSPSEIAAFIAAGVGVYTHTITQVNGEDRYYYVNFNAPGDVTAGNLQYYIPSADYLIKVRYDDRFPCIFFGGDTVIGEAVFAPIDGTIGSGGISPDIAGGNPVNNGDLPNQFTMATGFPYFKYRLNPRQYILAGSKAGTIDKIQSDDIFSLGFIRQMLCMFTAESKISLPYTFDLEAIQTNYGFQSFPSISYVMRPLYWDATDVYTQSGNVFTEYGVSPTGYPDELDVDTKPVNWIYGGFRAWQQTNKDYSHDADNFIGASKPNVGFTERSHFGTRVIWSVQRQINVQNSPGLKTFPPLNFRDINDGNGEIKMAWDALTDRGNNLYAFTTNGICLMLTNKFIARQVTGDDIGLLEGDGDQNIMEEIWISKDTGLNDEMWRGFDSYNNIGYFPNKNSVYRIENNRLQDIGRLYYHSRVYGDLLKTLRGSMLDNITGHYDIYHGEYYLTATGDAPFIINSDTDITITEPINTQGTMYDIYGAVTTVILPIGVGIDNLFIANRTDHNIDVVTSSAVAVNTLLPETYAQYTRHANTEDDWSWCCTKTVASRPSGSVTFVFADDQTPEQRHWLGYFDYAFDKYVSNENMTYGMRNAQTYTLDSGRSINGATITSSVLVATTGGATAQREGKEFGRVRINSNTKPTRVEFYDTVEQERSGLVQSFLDITTDSLYLKDYAGYENYVPRKTNPPYNRMQGRVMLVKVIHTADEDFKITDIQSFFKPLK